MPLADSNAEIMERRRTVARSWPAADGTSRVKP